MERMTNRRRPRAIFMAGTMVIAVLVLGAGIVAIALAPPESINSTSTGRSAPPATTVSEQTFSGLPDFQVLAANDLGMHCGNLDQRVVSILPPFNTLHAQIVMKTTPPQLLKSDQAEVVYSSASNPNDPALGIPPPSTVYKTNFWDTNPRTGNPYAFDAFNTHYPPGILPLFPLVPDLGLPVPDLQRLYLGDHQLTAGQQAMPSANAPPATQPYVANDPQLFQTFYDTFPFFINFPFGYTLTGIDIFAAEGIPAAPFDDMGRSNPYPVMRVQARAAPSNTLGLSTGTVLSSLDTVMPVSGEVTCGACHTSATDGGNGLATRGKGFHVATEFDDPQFGHVPRAVSIAYAWGLNVLRLHDLRTRTHLQNLTPVSCQQCHYSPALDLAHVGPKGPSDPDANGREQTLHHSFSDAMHTFHGKLKIKGAILFLQMPSPVGRSTALRDKILLKSCYMCHPGAVTKCLRGPMFTAGLACQDCHGNMPRVGNDFSRNVSPKNPGAFIVRGDYYTNPLTPRVPWANEPTCGSCHSGDALNNLAKLSDPTLVKSTDGIRLMRAFRSGDLNSKPIVAKNRRFAENQIGNKRQILYRLSLGHGGIFCEGCHGSTHAEWPNQVADANDNVAARQLQGHSGKLIECNTCHQAGSFSINDFIGNFDANGLMKGPHGMHPVNDPSWNLNHSEVFQDSATPPGTCQACHGKNLQGTVLSRMADDRFLPCDEAGVGLCRDTGQGAQVFLTKGTKVSCNICHEKPGTGGE